MLSSTEHFDDRQQSSEEPISEESDGPALDRENLIEGSTDILDTTLTTAEMDDVAGTQSFDPLFSVEAGRFLLLISGFFLGAIVSRNKKPRPSPRP